MNDQTTTQEIIDTEPASPATKSTNDKPKPPSVAIGPRGLEPNDMDGLWRIASSIMASSLTPNGIRSTEDCFIALAHGIEIGLPPMQAIQKIAVINGRPTVWGDAMMGLVLASGLLEDIQEEFEGDEGTDEFWAVCVVKRKGMVPHRTTFSVADAKAAGLWGKRGPWTDYYHRMLKMRARAFGLRDRFADVLGGLYMAEEAQDLEPPKQVENSASNAVRERITSMSEADTHDKDAPEHPGDDSKSSEPKEPERDPDTGDIIPDHIGQEDSDED